MPEDPRFARLKTDPRFRRPKKQKSKVVVDDRFKEFLDKKSSKKSSAARIDKYGRKKKQEHEQLERFYQLDEENDDTQSKRPDYARGEGLEESSDEELEEPSEQESEDDGYVALGADHNVGQDPEIDLDEDVVADLDAQAKAFQEANPETLATGVDSTSRLAVVNLDWDHVRAVHLFKVFSSLLSPTGGSQAGPSKRHGAKNVMKGRVLSVSVYPSDFGKKRMEKEEKEGPPSHIFKKSRLQNEDEVNERTVYEVGGEEEHDEDALRVYQIERLRYYYAIVTCDTRDAAAHLYEELQGTEFERSANVFDLSFVPEEMTFDDPPRDEATNESDLTGYRAVEFVTDALRHSKVKLTWDEDDPERSQITRRRLTQKEIDEGNFKHYIASSSDESESGDKKTMDRERLRSLLLGGDNDLPEGWNRGGASDDDDIDMEVTFAPGLDASKEDKDETTLERYQRKQREKRKKRKAEQEKDHQPDVARDEFFDASEDEQESSPPPLTEAKIARDSSPKRAEGAKHFNMKDILQAEKLKKRKGKGKNKKGSNRPEEEPQIQENFRVDTSDDRFKAIFEDHNYAIDPSNPHFKKTNAMGTLLAERAQRRTKDRPKPKAEGTERSLHSLVESVKRKSSASSKGGKRQRIH